MTSWKDLGSLLLVLTFANLAGVLWSEGAKLWVWALYLIGLVALGYLASRHSDRRIRAVRDAAPADRTAMLALLCDEEQALARLVSEMVSHEQIQQLPIDGDVFEYDRGPPALHNLLFWAAIIISFLPLFALAIGPLQPNQRLPAFVLGLAFAACAWVMHWAHTELGAQVIVTPFGIVERTSGGKRVGILWSELASIRHRRWLMALEIDARDGHRRIRVSYALKRFPQFMELLVSALKMLEERAA